MLASPMNALSGVICLLDTLDLALNGVDALNSADDARGGFGGDFAQRHFEIVMYAREAELRAQVGTAQDEQEVDELFKVSDIAKAKQIARDLAFVFRLRFANDAVAFEELFEARLVVGALFVLVPGCVDGIKVVSQPGAIGD